MTAPARALAERIVQAFVDAGLVEKQATQRLSDFIAEGKMKAEDWRLQLDPELRRERLS